MTRYIVSGLDSSLFSDRLQVITPSSAIAHHLRRLTNSEVAISHYSLDSLTQNIVRRQGWGIASVLLSRRLMQNAVAEVIPTQDVEGTAKAFSSAVKDLFRSGVNLQALETSNNLRVKQVCQLAIAYHSLLRQRKKLDPAEVYWQGTIEVAYRKPYLFYGYFALDRDELAIINAIAGDGSILVLPTDELYPRNERFCQWLQSQGWVLGDTEIRKQDNYLGKQLQSCFKQQGDLPEGISLNVYPNLDEEVRGVLSQVKVLLTQGVEAKDIILVCNDEQLYGETLIDLAWEYDLPLQVAYEIPLEQTRIGAWVKLLLEVIREDFPFEATAKLLSHPLAKLMGEDLWIAARETHPQGLTAWQELGVDLSAIDFSSPTYPRQEWIQGLQRIFTAWDVLEKGKYWAKEITAFYRLQEALVELSYPPEQVISKSAAIAEIESILTLLTTEAQPGTGGIELHHPAALLGTSYPYVFFLGSAESILPTEIKDDPILDFYNRKQLVKQGFAIETAVNIARKDNFNFYCFLNVPQEKIIFSYPESLDRASTLPSPYLTRLGLQPSLLPTLPLASVESARQQYLRKMDLLERETAASLSLQRISQAWQVEAQRESGVEPDEYDGAIGIPIDPQRKIFSASQLTQLGQCPFKWFSARLLKLQELPEAESDLTAAVRGNLYHRCLELSLAQIKTAKDLAQFNREQLAKAFTQAETELNLTQLPSWAARRQEHLDLLALNLAAADFLPPDREVVATEIKFDTQWYGLQVQGQIDRVDRTCEGLTTIDYKTSSIAPAGVQDATGKVNIDIQLAVYQDAIAQKYPNDTIDSATYYSLTKQKNLSRPQKDPAELAEFAQRVKTHLQQGNYPVSPDKDRKACQYCHYDSVCRQGDRLSRKSKNEK